MQEYLKQGYTVAVDMDLAQFFDSVNFDVLMRRVAAKVSDRQVLRLIWRYLRAGVMENGQWSPSEKGVPQGGPLSPLLANIVLHDLDMELEKRGHKFVRYADDFLVLVKSERAGQRVMASLTRFLEKKLRLTVNPQKSKVAKLGQCRFLGFTFRGKKIVWSEKCCARSTAGQGIDRSQLGRVDGIPAPETLGVPPGVVNDDYTSPWATVRLPHRLTFDMTSLRREAPLPFAPLGKNFY